MSTNTQTQVKKPLGQILVEMGYLTQAQLAGARRIQQKSHGKRLGLILVEEMICDEEQVAKAVALQAGLKYCQISKFEIPAEVVGRVPRDVAVDHLLFPLKLSPNGWLWVAVESPLDVLDADTLRFQLGIDLKPVISSEREILRAIDHYYEGPRRLEALKVRTGGVLVERALGQFEGELSLELRPDHMRLTCEVGLLKVSHELTLRAELQERLLGGLAFDGPLLTAARRDWQVVSTPSQGAWHDLLVRAYPEGRAGLSLTVRRLF